MGEITGKKYIVAKALERAMLAAAAADKDKNRRTWVRALGLLHDAPAADVEPVIRCLDCEYWIAEGASRADNCVCMLVSDAVLGEYHYTPPHGYCYKAERRKDCPPWLQEIKEALKNEEV